MKIIKPKKLTQGDLIGVISPGSSPDDITKIDRGVSYLEKMGYLVEVGANVGKEKGYLAGEDKERLNDLHYMFRKKEIKAIFSVRGGYGSAKLLDKIDYELIRKHPKIFIGYSDINALQLAFYKMTGLVSFAGPMVAVDFEVEVDPFTEEVFWRMITSNKKIGKIHNPKDEKFFVLNKGRGEGRLIGGNLTILTSLMGTNYMPSLKNAILFLEEISEPPYKIDRMLNHLKLGKILQSLRGVILGRFVDCYETDSTKKSLTLNEVILDYFDNQNFPVVYNVKHGHVKQNITLPIGLNCKVNASRGFIEIPDSAVR